MAGRSGKKVVEGSGNDEEEEAPSKRPQSKDHPKARTPDWQEADDCSSAMPKGQGQQQKKSKCFNWSFVDLLTPLFSPERKNQ